MEINNLIDDEVGEIRKLLHLRSTTNGKHSLLDTTAYPRLVQALLDVEVFVSETTPTNWEIRSKESGIVRLQHASFLLKTRKARILVDPHFVSGYSSHLQPGSLMLPQNFNSSIDAVLITHSHTDHYHVPSLMMMPRDTLIIVPNVSDESILCPRFANELRAIGFKNVVEPEWYSEPICVEDIEISALPFYGEQPLRYGHPRDKRLRNWGNTYLFRTPEFSAWCLIDSGSDGDGSMIHVAQSVKNQFGSIDVVLSNLQEFYVGVGRADPFYITGSGHYWLSLTADQIVRLPQMSQDLLTLGTKGVAEICSIVEAKTFLPYSHLWSEIGTAPPSESKMLQELNAEEAFTTSGTQIESWRIGDTWGSDRRAG